MPFLLAVSVKPATLGKPNRARISSSVETWTVLVEWRTIFDPIASLEIDTVMVELGYIPTDGQRRASSKQIELVRIRFSWRGLPHLS